MPIVVNDATPNPNRWFYMSAYATAVRHGYKGTEEQWLQDVYGGAMRADADAEAAAASEEAAKASEDAAAESESNAEAWAAGTRDGEAVPETDDTYHNNAKYYAESVSSRLDNQDARLDVQDAILAETRQQVASPFVIAATAAAMTDHTKGYVYTGSETGYVKGGWYSWDGSAWVLGGMSVDPNLTTSGAAADAKVTGDAIRYDENNHKDDIFADMFAENLTDFTSRGVTGTYDPSTHSFIMSGTATQSTVKSLSSGALPSSVIPGKMYMIKYNSSKPPFRILEVYQDDPTLYVSKLYTSDAIHIFRPDTIRANLVYYFEAGVSFGDGFTVPVPEMYEYGSNEDVKDVTPLIVPYSTISEYGLTLTDLPKYFTTRLSGAQANDFLGESFEFDLPANLTFTLERNDNRYYLNSVGSYKYIAYTLTVTGEVVWLREVDNIWKADVDQELNDHDQSIFRLVENEATDIQVFSDFKTQPGWRTGNGSTIIYENILSQPLVRTTKLPIKPGRRYYVGTDWNNTNKGAFFDNNGNVLSELTGDSGGQALEEYEYPLPDGAGDYSRSSYTKIYTFVAPENAYYLEYNIPNPAYSDRYKYMYISNKPLWYHSGFGDIELNLSDPILGYFSKRKLFVSGASTVMIDRLSRTGNFNNDGTSTTDYVVGFQEYLVPYWDEVRSFGYSSATNFRYDIVDGASKNSIYSSIVGRKNSQDEYIIQPMDLSGYDDFLLISDGVGVTANNLGDVLPRPGSPMPEDYETTYIGALRKMIDYIYTSNPDATIFLTTTHYAHQQYNPDSDAFVTFQTLNGRIKELGKQFGLKVIDLIDIGQNIYTNTRLSYDYNATTYAGGHWNNLGNRMVGQFIRKEILGF